MIRNSVNSKAPCGHCGLEMSSASLERHIRTQHQAILNIKRCYDPSILNNSESLKMHGLYSCNIGNCHSRLVELYNRKNHDKYFHPLNFENNTIRDEALENNQISIETGLLNKLPNSNPENNDMIGPVNQPVENTQNNQDFCDFPSMDTDISSLQVNELETDEADQIYHDNYDSEWMDRAHDNNDQNMNDSEFSVKADDNFTISMDTIIGQAKIDFEVVYPDDSGDFYNKKAKGKDFNSQNVQNKMVSTHVFDPKLTLDMLSLLSTSLDDLSISGIKQCGIFLNIAKELVELGRKLNAGDIDFSMPLTLPTLQKRTILMNNYSAEHITSIHTSKSLPQSTNVDSSTAKIATYYFKGGLRAQFPEQVFPCHVYNILQDLHAQISRNWMVINK